jgi:hypothetical protein
MKKYLLILTTILIFNAYSQDNFFENKSMMLGVSNTAVDSTSFGMFDISLSACTELNYGLSASLEFIYNYGIRDLDNYNAFSVIPNLEYKFPKIFDMSFDIGAGSGYTAVNFDGGQDIGIISQLFLDLNFYNISVSGGFRIINNDYYNLKTSFVGLKYNF